MSEGKKMDNFIIGAKLKVISSEEALKPRPLKEYREWALERVKSMLADGFLSPAVNQS